MDVWVFPAVYQHGGGSKKVSSREKVNHQSYAMPWSWYLSWADHCGRLYGLQSHVHIYIYIFLFKSCINDVCMRTISIYIYHIYIYSDHTYIYIVFDIIYMYILHGLHMSCIHWTCCTHMIWIFIYIYICTYFLYQLYPVFSLHINLFIELFFLYVMLRLGILWEKPPKIHLSGHLWRMGRVCARRQGAKPVNRLTLWPWESTSRDCWGWMLFFLPETWGLVLSIYENKVRKQHIKKSHTLFMCWCSSKCGWFEGVTIHKLNIEIATVFFAHWRVYYSYNYMYHIYTVYICNISWFGTWFSCLSNWGFQVQKCKKKMSTTNKHRPSDALGAYQRDADRRLAAGKQSRSKLGPTNFQGVTGRDTVLGGAKGWGDSNNSNKCVTGPCLVMSLRLNILYIYHIYICIISVMYMYIWTWTFQFGFLNGCITGCQSTMPLGFFIEFSWHSLEDAGTYVFLS